MSRPFSRSHGDISIVTRSPAKVLIRFFSPGDVGDDVVAGIELHAIAAAW